MRNFHLNHYEQAFDNWLIDNHIRYIAVDEAKRAALGRAKLKSFDYLIYPPGGQIIIAEVKGRKFKGSSLENLAGLECWVTTDDISGLTRWQGLWGTGHTAVFVFAYQTEQVDVDFDGCRFYDFNEKRYMFFAVKLDDYRCHMKLRSRKWKTVTLSAGSFRKHAVQMQQFLI